MFSKFSPNTKNSPPDYNQAARTVACIAETLKQADIEPRKMERLAFLVVAPLDHIDSSAFGDIVTKESIRSRVKRRVDEYRGERNEWFDRWFTPVLDEIGLGVLSWEELLDGLDPSYSAFYDECLRHNRRNASS